MPFPTCPSQKTFPKVASKLALSLAASMSDTMILYSWWLIVLICLSYHTLGGEYCVSQQINGSRCFSFDKLIELDHHEESSLVLIIDGPVELHIPLRFSNQTTLSLIGQNEGTVLCYNHSGVSFYAINRLIIDKLTFKHCGLLSNSTSTNTTNNQPPQNFTTLQYPTAIYIENCFDTVITQSNFENNHGVGVSIYNPTTKINIEDCKFVANNIMMEELDTLPGGGGLRIELTFCPPGVYFENLTKCNDGYDNVTVTVSLMLTRCTFANNNATALHDLTGYIKKS